MSALDIDRQSFLGEFIRYGQAFESLAIDAMVAQCEPSSTVTGTFFVALHPWQFNADRATEGSVQARRAQDTMLPPYTPLTTELLQQPYVVGCETVRCHV